LVLSISLRRDRVIECWNNYNDSFSVSHALMTAISTYRFYLTTSSSTTAAAAAATAAAVAAAALSLIN